MFVGLEGVGKSFLAGKYIDLNIIQSFKLAHMQGTGTVGLQMWSKPIQLSETTDAILIDSQAINNQDYSESVNKRLLQICMFFSSQIVLNTLGHISDQTLDLLMPLLEMEVPQQDILLSWVLRDFTLEFKTLTPNSYLSQCLEAQKAQNPE